MVGGMALLLGAGLAAYAAFHQPPAEQQQVSATPTPDQRRPSLDGELVDGSVATRPLIAVMVENHVDARPQTGLSKAEVVWETVAEGGITRYLALFQKDVGVVGPVRSARDYYAQIANGFGAVYVHVGGSPEALQQLAAGTYPRLVDVNEFYQGELFDRIKTRVAPHNAYAQMSAIRDRFAGKAPAMRAAFAFQNDLRASGDPATAVRIDFSLPSYAAAFTYDAGRGVYLRSVAGVRDVNAADNAQLAPKTVIVEMVHVTPVPGDEKGRVDIAAMGSGTAYFFRNGTVTTGTWKRAAGQTAAYADRAGVPVSFAPGQIWIAAVPDDGERVHWQ